MLKFDLANPTWERARCPSVAFCLAARVRETFVH
jgi:hypothetical protein